MFTIDHNEFDEKVVSFLVPQSNGLRFEVKAHFFWKDAEAHLAVLNSIDNETNLREALRTNVLVSKIEKIVQWWNTEKEAVEKGLVLVRLVIPKCPRHLQDVMTLFHSSASLEEAVHSLVSFDTNSGANYDMYTGKVISIFENGTDRPPTDWENCKVIHPDDLLVLINNYRNEKLEWAKQNAEQS